MTDLIGDHEFAQGKASNEEHNPDQDACETPTKILIVAHKEKPAPGYIGLTLEQLGYTLDIRRPCLGEGLPSTLRDHAAVVVLGGDMSANCNSEFIKREIRWIETPLKENKPYLGICLGGQLLAKHLGAKVAPCPHGNAEIGYYDQMPTNQLPADLEIPERVCQWHKEGFEIASGAKLLCKGLGHFENQAFSYGDNAYGLQFHPEVTVSILHRWLTTEPEALALNGAKERQEIIDDHTVQSRLVRDWLKRFLTEWVNSVSTTAAESKMSA